MARHRSGYVQIDVAEILNEVDNETLLDELRSRKLVLSGAGESYDSDAVREAFVELRGGRVAEALAILDRLLNPKWHSADVCASAYARHQGKMI